MTELDLLIYGSLWRNSAHPQAGWELIRSLGSADPRARAIAQELLVDAGPQSIELLQVAVASGAATGKDAADCIAAFLMDEGQRPTLEPDQSDC